MLREVRVPLRARDAAAPCAAGVCQERCAAQASRSASGGWIICKRRGSFRCAGLWILARWASGPALLLFLLACFSGQLLLLSRLMVIGFGHEISVLGEVKSGGQVERGTAES
jgi:hypothetical protein